MCTGILAKTLANVDLTVTDIAALFIALLLLVNAIGRAKKTRSRNPGLLRANILMILVLICSISVVYETLDPMMGDRSILNLITHLLMVYTGWEIVKATTKMLQPFDRKEIASPLVHGWVPIASLVGTLVAYMALNPVSSRGMEDYDHQFTFVFYWLATVAPLAIGALHLVPRIAKIAPLLKAANKLTRVAVTLLWLSFIGVLLCIAGWAFTAVWQELYPLREAIVTTTLLLFTVAFLTATAALPQPIEKQSLRHCQTRSQI